MGRAEIYHPSATDEIADDYEGRVLAQLNIEPHDAAGLAAAIRAGFPVDTVDKLAAALEIPARRLMQLLALSPATIGRRKLKKKPLTPQESDRLYRIVSIFATTIRLFEGNVAAAREWLQRPARGLGNLIPLEQLDTEPGSEAVVDLIGRIEHGVAN